MNAIKKQVGLTFSLLSSRYYTFSKNADAYVSVRQGLLLAFKFIA